MKVFLILENIATVNDICDIIVVLYIKALINALSLTSMNSPKTKLRGNTAIFQITSIHDIGNLLVNKGYAKIQLRYRSLSPNILQRYGIGEKLILIYIVFV
jgi:hypothetical protein